MTRTSLLSGAGLDIISGFRVYIVLLKLISPLLLIGCKHQDELKVKLELKRKDKKTQMMIVKNNIDLQNVDVLKNEKDNNSRKPSCIHVSNDLAMNVQIMGLNQKGQMATFQEALKVTLKIGQLFALMPIFGISSRNALEVKFKTRSWKCLYTFISLCGQSFMTGMCIRKLFVTETTLKATTSVIFYGSNCVTLALFMKMAKCWPKLVRYIAKTEDFGVPISRKLISKCNITCVIVLSLSLLEHSLSLLSEVYGANACSPTPINSYERFVKQIYPWVFNTIPYYTVLGIMCQMFHFQATFTWNFSDLFVICISYYLTSRLHVVNMKLHASQGKRVSESFWRGIREEYGRATQLVRKVDNVISGIVFISFANNLFFIILQLFYTLESSRRDTGDKEKCEHPIPEAKVFAHYITSVYFTFSLVYLIGRSLAMSLIAAEVNTASTVPAPVLYDVPSSDYCEEVQRLITQVNGEKVAISGLQFFNVTRGLLLTIAGTIVTYELVMFQIN